MADIARNPSASLELRGRMNAELAQYVYPKRKAVEQYGRAWRANAVGKPDCICSAFYGQSNGVLNGGRSLTFGSEHYGSVWFSAAAS